MTTEDQLTSRLVEYYQNQEFEHDISVEQHYNYYGDRGVVDLATKEVETGYVHLYEIKSNAAINAATGANEIIRQFNKMRQYFFRDESTFSPDGWPTFELCFLPTYEAYRHIHNNAELYKSAVQNDVDLGFNELKRPNGVDAQVTMRPYDEDSITPVVLFAGESDYRETIKQHDHPGGGLLGEWVKTQYLNMQES